MSGSDTQFLQQINRLACARSSSLPELTAGAGPEAVTEWTAFLESAVRSGIPLTDPRWARIRLTGTREDRTEFALTAATAPSAAETRDDFRLGLQLLVGLLEPDDSDSDTDDA